MGSVAAQTYLTPREHLAFEHKATTKHENNLVADIRILYNT